MSKISYIVQGSQITIVLDNKPYQIGPTHISYKKIIKAIKNNKLSKLKDLVDPKEIIVKYAEGNISIDGNTLTWNGEKMHNAITSKMIAMHNDGFPITPLIAFLDNLMSNTSNRAINELYKFLDKGNLPFTDDGHFLAYKRVNENYTDSYSGTISNAIGETVTMPRNKVDDDSNRTCSTGLHFCSLDYIKHFHGARVVILKINPRDVVSIPADYNDTKGRCCRYTVVGEVEDMHKAEKVFTSTTVESQFNDVPDATLTKNSTGQWIRIATGTFASKAEIADHKALVERLRNR